MLVELGTGLCGYGMKTVSTVFPEGEDEQINHGADVSHGSVRVLEGFSAAGLNGREKIIFRYLFLRTTFSEGLSTLSLFDLVWDTLWLPFLTGKCRASCGQPYLKRHLPAQRSWFHQVALGLPGLSQ